MPRSRPATWAAASTRGRSSVLRPANATRLAIRRRRRVTRSGRSTRRRSRPTRSASSPTFRPPPAHQRRGVLQQVQRHHPDAVGLPVDCRRIQPDNIGKADVKGVELEVYCLPDRRPVDRRLAELPRLQVQDRHLGRCRGPDRQGITPYTPNWTWSSARSTTTAAARQRARLPPRRQLPVAHLLRDVQHHVGGDPRPLPGNGRVYYKSPGDEWEFSLEVQNIFDKYYFVTKDDVTTLWAKSRPARHAADFLVSVRRNFGAPQARRRRPRRRRRLRRRRHLRRSGARGDIQAVPRWLGGADGSGLPGSAGAGRWRRRASAAEADGRCQEGAARAIAPPFSYALREAARRPHNANGPRTAGR